MALRLQINSVDKTSILLDPPSGSWQIDKLVGPEITIFEFTLQDLTVAQSLTEGHVVTLDDDATGVIYFSGILSETEYEPLGLGRNIHCTAQGWMIVLDKTTFAKVYVDQTDQAIIQNIFTAAISGITDFNTTNVLTSGKTLDRISFQGVTVRTALDTIASITNYKWHVDDSRNLYYGPEGFVSNIRGLSDSPDDVTFISYRNPIYRFSLGQYNACEVRGSKDISPDTTDTYFSDGVDTVFLTGIQKNTNPITEPNSGEDRVIINRNTGTEGVPTWTAQTVGIEGKDTLGILGVAVLWNPLTRRLQFQTAPPNFATNSFQVKGRWFRNIYSSGVDHEAVSAQGRTYKKVLFLPEVDTIALATDLVLAFLRENSTRRIFTCNVDNPNFLPGEYVLVTCTTLGLLNKPMRIEHIVISPLGGGQLTFALTLRWILIHAS